MLIKSTILFAFFTIILMSASFAYAQNEDFVQTDVGGMPAELELVNGDVYVSDPSEGRILIIDGKTNQLRDTIATQVGVYTLQHIEGTNKLYATLFEQPEILLFDLDTKEQVKTIQFPDSVMTKWSKADKPYGQREYVHFQTGGVGMDYDPNDQMLYVANLDGNSIEVIDTNTDSYSRTITGVLSPVHVVVDPQTNTLLVLQYTQNQVSFIDLNTDQIIAELNTGLAPANVALDTHHRKAYISHHASSEIAVINLDDQSIVKKIKTPFPTHAIGIDDNEEIVYATYLPDTPITQPASTNQVVIINALSDEVMDVLDIEANPYGIIIDSENMKGYATILRDGQVVAAYLETGAIERVEQEMRDTTDSEVTAPAESDSTQNEKTSGCLIATAAYGTELAPQVQLLREVRDNVLFSTNSGTTFMAGFNQFYYVFSPTISDLERQSPIFKEIIKATIAPMLSTLSILNYVDIDSESEMLGYGIGIILLNLGMYFVVPAIVILKLRSKIHS